MTTRTVTVHLKAKVGDYLAGMKMSEKAAKDLRQETDKLNKAGWSMTKGGGIVAALAGVPGFASAAAAGLAAIPAFAVSGAAAIGTLAVATNGVGEALKAVGEGDAKKLHEAMAVLSEDAREFVLEYQRIRPALSALGDRTQDAFFHQLLGNLDKVTGTYLPLLMRQSPRLAAELGRGGAAFATWSTAPSVVAKVNGQFDLAIDLTRELSRLLRAGAGLFLDLADAGADFARGTVGGLADGAEALERWVSHARATGHLNQIFENGTRILQRLGEVAGQAGELIADIADNPALVDGAHALLDVLGLTLDVVRALLMAFEGLPAGVQSSIVTFAVFGGIAIAVTGRVLALKASLDAMKLSAAQAGTAVKGIGAFMGGPWGIAITVATLALGAYSTAQAKAEARADEFRSTLDEQTGAITDNTRALVANQLEQKGFLALGAKYGITGQQMVDAILSGGDALEQLRAKVTALASLDNPDFDQLAHLKAHLGVASKEAQGFVAAQQRVGGAVGNTTTKVETQVSALQALATELRKQADPAFALIKAQQDLASAQTDYNDAVKDYGKNSPEAKAASVKLAEQAIILTEAIAGAGTAFDGKLTPAMRATLEAANLSEQQIKDVEEAFRNAKTQGDKFAKTYTAKMDAQTAAAYKAVQDLQLKVLGLKDKTIRVSATVYWKDSGLHVGTGTQLRRWGGIDYHMARGGTIQAHHATAPTIMYGERATGGEAFIPRNGDFGRSLSILATAAGWYGHRLAPVGAAPAPSAPVAPAGGAIGAAQLAQAVRGALQGMTVVLDGRAVGQLTGRQADLYRRAG